MLGVLATSAIGIGREAQVHFGDTDGEHGLVYQAIERVACSIQRMT